MKSFNRKTKEHLEELGDYYVDAVRTRYLNKQIEKNTSKPPQYNTETFNHKKTDKPVGGIK